jgi:HxlR-like helix-turn-helix protein
MAGMHSFNDIHRGVPLISRAVLVARLRELEEQGIVERRPRPDGNGHEYWLTAAGEGFRAAVNALAEWGMTHTQDRIKTSDLDPALLMWGLRRRVNLGALPARRVVLRFEFSGVPASRTKFKVMWLMLERSGVDVCVKDPGFAVDLILRGTSATMSMSILVGWNGVAWWGTSSSLMATGRSQRRFRFGSNLTRSAAGICRRPCRCGNPHQRRAAILALPKAFDRVGSAGGSAGRPGTV